MPDCCREQLYLTLMRDTLLRIGIWWLQVFTANNYLGSISPSLLDANHHLLPGIIDDLFLVCHYSAT